MEQVEVEITGMAITARYGMLKSGDILRTDAEFAKHLVEDCSAAKYTTVKQEIPSADVAPDPESDDAAEEAEEAEQPAKRKKAK